MDPTALPAIANAVADFNAVLSDSANDPSGETIIAVVGQAQTILQTAVAEFSAGNIDEASFVEETTPSNIFQDVPVSPDSPDNDADGIVDLIDPDDDNDGVRDPSDAFPFDSDETRDFDGDGIGDNADTDDDGDGVLDVNDDFPFDSTETLDTDTDGVGNNADPDDDNDGVVDADDALPLDATETLDTDLDGIGNNADDDDDGDGVGDGVDAFPLDGSETVDTDFDGIGNNADTDDDNDLIPDSGDAFPEIPIGDNIDTDGDGAPDDCIDSCADSGMQADADDDNDGVEDSEDYAPLDPDVQYAPIGVNGSGVKGPLVNGLAELFSIDGSVDNLRGEIVGVGSTDERARITGIEIPFPVAPPYLLRISAVDGTTDLTTGKYPVITQHTTLVTQTSFDLGGNFYATPLTSLATAMVVQFADSGFEPLVGNGDGFVDATEFEAAIHGQKNELSLRSDSA